MQRKVVGTKHASSFLAFLIIPTFLLWITAKSGFVHLTVDLGVTYARMAGNINAGGKACIWQAPRESQKETRQQQETIHKDKKTRIVAMLL